MESSTTSMKEWILTDGAFAKFLTCLDPDPDRAGEKYESLRQMLVKIFDWRGAHFPEECADETLNRIIRKIDEGETFRDLHTYCQGVARLVFLETLRRPENNRADIEELAHVAAPALEPEEVEVRQACFEGCLRKLPAESQQLILRYYQDEKRQKIKNRLSLAEKLGIPLNTLRSRAQRIRDTLDQCIDQCIKNKI